MSKENNENCGVKKKKKKHITTRTSFAGHGRVIEEEEKVEAIDKKEDKSD